jgi:cytochrome b561
MAIANTRSRYGTVAMTLHWLIALAVLTNICLGLYHADFIPDNAPPDMQKFAFQIIQLHKSIGLTVLVLSIARLLWRLVNPIPPLPDGMSPALRVVAHATHFLLYVLIIAIPLSGWALVSASRLGLPTPYFGIFHWPNLWFLADLPGATKHALHPTLALTHTVLAWSAIVLIPIHVLGALYHQFLRRDDVLKRMIPGTKVAEPA